MACLITPGVCQPTTADKGGGHCSPEVGGGISGNGDEDENIRHVCGSIPGWNICTAHEVQRSAICSNIDWYSLFLTYYFFAGFSSMIVYFWGYCN